jgi:hypothetical protein
VFDVPHLRLFDVDPDTVLRMEIGTWRSPNLKPPAPGIYRVQVPIYEGLRNDVVDVNRRWARWTGEWWCCWSPSAHQAAMCQWKGPSAGYCWFDAG